MNDEMDISKGGGEITIEDVRARVEAQVASAVQEAGARFEAEAAPEIAEIQGWWNLWAYGPITTGLAPHSVIKAGETAWIVTVLWLNNYYPRDVSACQLLSNLACEFEVKYCTGDLCTWTPGPAPLHTVHTVKMVRDRCWYVDLLQFRATADMEGCYETNICARIKGCPEGAVPPFAGFATRIYSLDWDVFYPYGPGQGPGYRFGQPFRYMIYP